MSEYGTKIINSRGQVVSGATPNMAIVAGGVSWFLNAYTGQNINFSAVNKTNNVDVVWNTDNWVSPYWYCYTPGQGTFYNNFWLGLESKRVPGYYTQVDCGVISVGTGSKQDNIQSGGIYHISNAGAGILDSRVKMLKLRGQYYVLTNTAAVTGTPSSVVSGWVWSSSIDMSNLAWDGPNKWFNVTPVIGMYADWSGIVANLWIRVSTVFYLDPATDIFWIGDYYNISSTAFRTPTYPARNVLYVINAFSESN